MRHAIRLPSPSDESDVEAPAVTQRNNLTSQPGGELTGRDGDKNEARAHAQTIVTKKASRKTRGCRRNRSSHVI